LNDGINFAKPEIIVQYEVKMVAVGSKSMPDKQGLDLNLSKNSKDNQETDLFSEIFSSEGINIPNSEANMEKLKNHSKDQANSKSIPIKAKEINKLQPELTGDQILLRQDGIAENTEGIIKGSEDIIKDTEQLIIKDTEQFINLPSIDEEIENKTGLPIDPNTLPEEEIDSKNETKFESDEQKHNSSIGNSSIGFGNILINDPKTSKRLPETKKKDVIDTPPKYSFSNQSSDDNPSLNLVLNKAIKNKNITSDHDIDLSHQMNGRIVKEHSQKPSITISYSTDDKVKNYFDEINIKNSDYSKITKQNLLIEEKSMQINKNIESKKTLVANTEKYFDTRYLNKSNTYFPQNKNNLFNNQNIISSGSSEINHVSHFNNSGNNNSNQQGGNTQSQTTSNNFQTINEMKEMLDMADKRWTNNLVSRLQKAHSSKLNELELVLTPKNLGKMKIKISLSDKTAFVKITTGNASASSLILEQENKLNEMFKQVGLVLEDFSSSQSFQQSANDRQKDETKNNLSEVSKTNKPSDKEQEDNYIKDESLLNIKV